MLHYEDSLVEVHRVVVGPMDNNVYVIRSKETGRRRAHRRRQRARAAARDVPDLGVRQVLETHGHWDHIQAVPAVRDAGFEVSVSPPRTPSMLPSYDLLLEDDAVIEVGRLRLRTIATPGHTPGSYRASPWKVRRCSSAGTRSSPADPGNTKFPGGDFATIIRSIEDRLFSPVRARHRRAPRPRRRHDHRDREPHLQEWVDRGW